MSIAVTGASGQLGRLVAERLLTTLDPSQVVLITRTRESLSDFAERGADVRAGDFRDPSTLEAAFAGVDRVLLISLDTVDDRLEAQQAAVEAARKAGVSLIAYTSIPRPEGDNPAAVVPSHAATEQAIIDSGVPYTFLRNALYAHMQAPTLQNAMATGQLVTNAGDGGSAYVSREDCAAAAAAVLTTDGHENTAYDITGPEAVTPADLAALASELSGKEVAVVPVPDDAFIAGLVEHAGLPEAVARLIASFGTAQRLGFLDGVTPAVADLTGREPETLRDVVARELAGSPS